VFGKLHRAVRKSVDQKVAAKPIHFDPLPRYDGSRHLAFFLGAIEESRRVEFQYRSFRADDLGKTVVFDPWFLRHYDRRWYVGGFSHHPSERFVRVFPLERVEGEPRHVGYCHDKPRDFDAATYWRHIYGITMPPNGRVESVVLKFSPPQDKYFLHTPFFEPFEVLEQSAQGLTLRFSLMVNIDLIRKLASFGADVRVVEPQHLRDALRDFFQRALLLYEEQQEEPPVIAPPRYPVPPQQAPPR
jgi:predicted DNA-binding transcriptional regulator YafY